LGDIFNEQKVGITNADQHRDIFNERKVAVANHDQHREKDRRRESDRQQEKDQHQERDQQQEKPDNIGLGLPFCKRVMKAFGGDILVKSVVGEGTEFCLKF
jgi:light-regulated signal transduction histidine kinase (bacteriophytochrome)